MAVILPLLWSAALAAGGIAILRRAAPFLDPLERRSYGAVLGLVAGSLAVLALAWNRGLDPGTILLVGVGAAALAIAEPWLPRRGPAPEAAPAPRPSRAALAVLGGFVALWAAVWARAVVLDDAGLWTRQVNLWGDWSLHFGDVTSFAWGDNFPPRHPRLADHPLSYHFLATFTAACWVKLGMTPMHALVLHSAIGCVLVTFTVFAFARRLLGEAGGAALALALFLLGGGLGWIDALRDALAAGGGWRGFADHAWDARAQQRANFRWLNVMWAYLEPQRSTLYGIPLALLALTLAVRAAVDRRVAGFLAAGLVVALLPIANLGAVLALALLTPALVAAFPSRGWIAFGLTAAALGLPQILLLQDGGGGAARAIRWQPGWVARPDPWAWFWLKNLGALAPVTLLAALDRDAPAPASRRLLLAFALPFAVANLVVFQPWDWDNTKVLVYAYLAACVLAAGWIARAWRATPAAWSRALWAVVVASMLAPGALLHAHELFGSQRHVFLTPEELDVARWARDHTPPRARFLVGLQHNHPVPMLSGRPVVASYPGWLWSHGHDPKPVERDVRAMYAAGPAADSLLARYRVAYAVIGERERRTLGADTAAWNARHERVYRSATYAIYRVGAAPGSARP